MMEYRQLVPSATAHLDLSVRSLRLLQEISAWLCQQWYRLGGSMPVRDEGDFKFRS
ncbi:MAG: hypothetical protein JWO42_2754, partial [Chloroflexi bacterium]|nr:hypothetical protein [Chloroflexota bacterium]